MEPPRAIRVVVRRGSSAGAISPQTYLPLSPRRAQACSAEPCHSCSGLILPARRPARTASLPECGINGDRFPQREVHGRVAGFQDVGGRAAYLDRGLLVPD